MAVMSTSFKRTYASTPHLPRLLVVSDPDPEAGHCQPIPLPETPKHSHRQAWLSLLWGHCSFLLGTGAHKVLFVPPRVSASPILCKFCNQILKHSTWCNLKSNRMISVCFQGISFSLTVIQVYISTTNVKEAEVEQFYEGLQDLPELKPKKDVLFIGDWNAKVGNQEIPGVTGKFDLGVQNEAGQG